MKKTITTFVVLWLALAGLAISWHTTHSGPDPRIGWSAGRYWSEDTGTLGANSALYKRAAAVVNSQLPIVTVSYNQYDSAQSSRVGEQVMGLPRIETVP